MLHTEHVAKAKKCSELNGKPEVTLFLCELMGQAMQHLVVSTVSVRTRQEFVTPRAGLPLWS